MITLITGSPGSGKTLYCIDKIIRPVLGTSVDGVNDAGETEKHPRTIYTNINNLLLDHELIDAQWLEKLHENKTTGAFIVFDEVQRVWPNRPAGSKKPAAVEYLETHRHDGVDIVLLTQNPQLLDPAVRALVGQHLHMRRLGGSHTAIVYEWDACSNALNYRAAFTKKIYRYSRAVFKLYKSSKLHTKQKRSVPFAVWMVLAGLLGSAYMWPRFFDFLDRNKPGAETEQATPANGGINGPGAMHMPALAAKLTGEDTASYGGGHGTETMTPEEYRDSLKPRISNQPYSAPRYDQLTRPVVAPYPAACIEMSGKCNCYTQQATPLNIDEMSCREFVRGGVFIDFAQQDTPRENRPIEKPAESKPVEYMGPLEPQPPIRYTTPDMVAAQYRE